MRERYEREDLFVSINANSHLSHLLTGYGRTIPRPANRISDLWQYSHGDYMKRMNLILDSTLYMY